MKQKERSSLSWVFEFAGIHKNRYTGSVLAALLGVQCGIAPYAVTAVMLR